MTKSAIFLLATLGLVGAVTLPKISLPVAKVIVRAIDEDGRPVAEANVKLWFLEQKTVIDLKPAKDKPTEGLTDANGLFGAEGRTTDDLGCDMKKTGFYAVWPTIQLREHVNDKWDPWGATYEGVLRKIIKPIPMYAKSLNEGVPTRGQPVGYDLAAGDWVAPYGRGRSSDFIFLAELRQTTRDDFDYKLTVSFPNKGDGIQTFGSLRGAFKSPRFAPESGYAPVWEQTRSRRPGQSEQNTQNFNANYFFRVRTVLDTKGNVISANYGKIYGDFITFTYYFNPTVNDRNMEYDPQKNLIQGLSDLERVRNP